jgi:hypothetical protein
MAEQDKRPEATHRQRAQLGTAHMPSWPHDANGEPMAIVSGTASDLIPTVQFGNVLVGPVTITRPVSNESLEKIIKEAAATQKAAEAVCGSERRIIEWGLDPSKKIANPATGAQMGPVASAPPQPPTPPQPEQAAPPAADAAPPATPAPPSSFTQ